MHLDTRCSAWVKAEKAASTRINNVTIWTLILKWLNSYKSDNFLCAETRIRIELLVWFSSWCMVTGKRTFISRPHPDHGVRRVTILRDCLTLHALDTKRRTPCCLNFAVSSMTYSLHWNKKTWGQLLKLKGCLSLSLLVTCLGWSTFHFPHILGRERSRKTNISRFITTLYGISLSLTLTTLAPEV